MFGVFLCLKAKAYSLDNFREMISDTLNRSVNDRLRLCVPESGLCVLIENYRERAIGNSTKPCENKDCGVFLFCAFSVVSINRGQLLYRRIF